MSRSRQIKSLFRVPDRFLRSVQLERDFGDPGALAHYILTPTMAHAFARIADGLRIGSGRRAWRVTGDFGVGKSSFALVLAHLLSGTGPGAKEIAGKLGWDDAAPRLWPILVTGSREGIVTALARGIGDALRLKAKVDAKTRQIVRLIERAVAVEKSGRQSDLLALIAEVHSEAGRNGCGVLLVIDEMGKLLEHAAQNTDSEDVFVLQRLAEMASRRDVTPFVLLGLLHRGFQAYAERLPAAAKHEWEKVAGRFEEIVFDQPLMHTAALVAGALNTNLDRLPAALRQASAQVAAATAETGWLGGRATGAADLDAARLYPLHPILLAVLVRFFSRFGQHERSLFGFLLSNEPFGLQAFAERSIDAKSWYSLADFYDYVRTVFGHRLAGASYRSQWLRISATVDAAADRSDDEIALLKSVAILNLLDADDLLPTERALCAAFEPKADVVGAMGRLERDGLLFRRGKVGAWRLWPHSSVSLESALSMAARALGPQESVGPYLPTILSSEPILARRHYVESGTMRFFEVRYAVAGTVVDVGLKPTNADGIVLIALCDTQEDCRQARTDAKDAQVRERDDILIGVTTPLRAISAELRELHLWQWVSSNVPELGEDHYAFAEVARQLSAAKRVLTEAFDRLIGFRAGGFAMEWMRGGRKVSMPERGTTALLSRMCDEIYANAPLVQNELVNRNVLSSAASAARMRLIERIFEAADQPLLGLPAAKAPPEKSMYLSILSKGGVHVESGDGFAIVEPVADPLRLRPAIDRLVRSIVDARGDRISIPSLITEISAKPFGVRAGVAYLLLAIVLRTRSHELAVYEGGTFMHRFGPTDFMRLIKAPSNFEVQHCRVAGIRIDVFNRLAAAFATPATRSRRPDLLDVVRPLCQFAAQLPESTRRTQALSETAIAVRDVLLSAREPFSMLFGALPRACGLEPFGTERSDDGTRSQVFISRLRDAVGELQAAYSALLERVIDRTSTAIGDEGLQFDRARLASRAARVSMVAREPRLRTFALRLRDPGLSDENWAEALASYVIAKPPSRWSAADEARFTQEAGALGEVFQKAEAAAFSDPVSRADANAVRINLTRGDGEDLVKIIQPADDDHVEEEAAEYLARMTGDRQLRLQLLTQMLWLELRGSMQHGVATSIPDRRATEAR